MLILHLMEHQIQAEDTCSGENNRTLLIPALLATQPQPH